MVHLVMAGNDGDIDAGDNGMGILDGNDDGLSNHLSR